MPVKHILAVLGPTLKEPDPILEIFFFSIFFEILVRYKKEAHIFPIILQLKLCCLEEDTSENMTNYGNHN